MQEIELPDGTILEFPEGMSDREIAAKVKDYMAMSHQPPELPATDIGTGEGALRAGFSGATLGFGDNIVGALAAATHPMFNPDDGSTFSERYDHYTGREREKHADFAAARPAQAIPAELAGALTTALATGAPGFVSGAKTPTGLLARAAGEGAAYGAVAGAGYGDDQPLEGAAQGAIMGALTGGAAPIVLNAGRGLYNAAAGRTTANMGTPASQAQARAARAADAAGMSRQDVDARLAELGPDGALMDAMGTPGRSLARSAANAEPEARDMITAFTRGRTEGGADRITQALLDAGGLDTVKTAQEIKDHLRSLAKADIDRAYAAARAAGQDMPMPAFIGQSDMAKKAVKEGERLAKERMVAEGKTGEPSTLAILDEAKKFLDGKAQPALGRRATNEEAIAGGLSERLRTETDDLLPEYGGARDKARVLFEREGAVDLGAEAAKSRPPADIVRRIDDTPYRPEVAQGFAAAKANEVESRRSTPGLADSLFGSRRQRDALDASLGPKAEDVGRQLARERAFAETAREVEGNSSTARQLAEMGVTGAAGAGAGLWYGGDPQSAGAGALSALVLRGGLRVGGRAIRAAKAGDEREVAKELARVLMSQEPAKSVLIPPTVRSEIMREITRVLSATGGAGGAAISQ